MRIVGIFLLGNLLLAPCAGAAPGWPLRMDGIGPLQVGMRFAEANALLGNHLGQTSAALRESCDQVALPGHPGVLLMFVDEVLVRIDMWKEGERTEAGVEVGAPVRQVFAAYPQVAAERHAYDETERYLTVRSPDGSLALRFETRHGKVGGMYAGQYRAVRYVEGCL